MFPVLTKGVRFHRIRDLNQYTNPSVFRLSLSFRVATVPPAFSSWNLLITLWTFPWQTKFNSIPHWLPDGSGQAGLWQKATWCHLLLHFLLPHSTHVLPWVLTSGSGGTPAMTPLVLTWPRLEAVRIPPTSQKTDRQNSLKWDATNLQWRARSLGAWKRRRNSQSPPGKSTWKRHQNTSAYLNIYSITLKRLEGRRGRRGGRRSGGRGGRRGRDALQGRPRQERRAREYFGTGHGFRCSTKIYRRMWGLKIIVGWPSTTEGEGTSHQKLILVRGSELVGLNPTSWNTASPNIRAVTITRSVNYNRTWYGIVY